MVQHLILEQISTIIPHITAGRQCKILSICASKYRKQVLMDGANGILPFAAITAGRWHGTIYESGNWLESEADAIAYDQDNIIIREYMYCSKKKGLSVLENPLPFIAEVLPGRCE